MKNKYHFKEFKINEDEWNALHDEPPVLFKVYGFIKTRMDHTTKIAGVAEHFDEQSFREALSCSSRPGRKASEPITQKQIRYWIKCLEKKGLVKHLGNFVFECLLVDRKAPSKTNRARGGARGGAQKNDNNQLNLKEIEKEVGREVGSEVGRTSYINNKKHYLYKNTVRFDEFWNVYPRQYGEHKVREFWKKNNLDEIADEIIQDVILRKEKHVTWLGEQKYIVYPLRYLKEKMWKNPIEEKSHAKHTQSSYKSVGQRTDDLFSALREITEESTRS